MIARFAFLLACFVFGALLAAAPLLIYAHELNEAEHARREMTMGPAIMMFLGFLAAPFGGLIALLIGVLVSWNWSFERKSKLLRLLRAASVRCDHDGVQFYWARGASTTIRWDDVARVVIRTTDAGPFDDDVFFVVETDQASGAVAQGAEGASQLFARLQDLPGFNNAAVIESMGCTDNCEFTCWQRGDQPPQMP